VAWPPYDIPSTRALLVPISLTMLDGTEGDAIGDGTPSSPAPAADDVAGVGW
jgi:hypothetical protein